MQCTVVLVVSSMYLLIQLVPIYTKAVAINLLGKSDAQICV